MLQVNVMNRGRLDFTEEEDSSFAFIFDESRFLVEMDSDEQQNSCPKRRQLQDIVYGWQKQGCLNKSDGNTITGEQYIHLLMLFQDAGYGQWFLPYSGIKLLSKAETDKMRFEAARALGSVRSEKKTAAARENAKRPRPNAQGKPKPRKPKT